MLIYIAFLFPLALACSSSGSNAIEETGIAARVPSLNPVQICKDKLETAKLIVTPMPGSQIKVDWSKLYWKCHNLTMIESVVVQIENLDTSTHSDKNITQHFNDTNKWKILNLKNPCNAHELVLKVIFTHKDGKNETKSQPTYLTAKDTEICDSEKITNLVFPLTIAFALTLAFVILAFLVLWFRNKAKQSAKEQKATSSDQNPVYSDYYYEDGSKRKNTMEVRDRSSTYGKQEQDWEEIVVTDKNIYYGTD